MLDDHRQTMPHGPLTIRAATVADVVETARVWRGAWLDGHRGHVSPDLLAARDKGYFSDRAAAMVQSTLLAETPDGQVAGIAIVDSDEVVQLAVDGSARRRGVGAALLHAAEARVATGHDEAWLAVVPGNVAARKLYAKRGWHDTGDYTHRAPGPAEPIPVLVRRYVKKVRIDADEAP